MKSNRHPRRQLLSLTGSRPRGCRRGVLTLGLVICMVILFALAGVLWNYQYMVVVNRDVCNTSELTMDALKGPWRDDVALELAKAQLDYAVVSQGLYAGGNNVCGPFTLSGLVSTANITTTSNFALATTPPLTSMAELVTENSKPNATRIYKAGFNADNNPYTISIMINGGTNGNTNTGQVMASTPRNIPSDWTPTIVGGTATPAFDNSPAATAFNQRATSRLNFFRYRNVGFLSGIFASPKTTGLGTSAGTLEEDVQQHQDIFESYVALDPYVFSINRTTLNADGIKTPSTALSLSIFEDSDALFLKSFYPENASVATASTTITFTFKRTWTVTRTSGSPSYNTNTGVLDTSTCKVAGAYTTGNGDVGDFAIYAGITPSSLTTTTSPVSTATTINYDNFATYFKTFPVNSNNYLNSGNLVCFPVVRDLGGNTGHVIDFIIFRVHTCESPADPSLNQPTNTVGNSVTTVNEKTISLIPTCVVTNAITCDQGKRKNIINAITNPATAFNAPRCNTSMSTLKVQDTPIFTP